MTTRTRGEAKSRTHTWYQIDHLLIIASMCLGWDWDRNTAENSMTELDLDGEAKDKRSKHCEGRRRFVGTRCGVVTDFHEIPDILPVPILSGFTSLFVWFVLHSKARLVIRGGVSRRNDKIRIRGVLYRTLLTVSPCYPQFRRRHLHRIAP